MGKSHLPLLTWFQAIYMAARDKRGCSTMQLSPESKLPYNTAWFLLHRIRYAIGQRDPHYLLTGIVELDDTYFGGPKSGGKRGRGTGKSKALVGISKEEQGRLRFLKIQVVPNLKGKRIGRFAQDALQERTAIHSDAYHSYRKSLVQKSPAWISGF